jgi:UDP-glucose 4-epimerase
LKRIMISGSEGMIGARLGLALEGRGYAIERLDLRAADADVRGDVRDPHASRERAEGCVGIVHLAAVSRVVWGERDPDRCWQTNVHGTANVLQAAAKASRFRPWVLFASSREVYGQPSRTPVREDDPLEPVNIYGRSKAEGERLVEEARAAGLRTAIVRLSNVYGCWHDHPDRVVPAFARAAATGAPMCIRGRHHTFDFTHVDDTVRGLVMLIEALGDGLDKPPPIHFVTGRATTLGELAALANVAGDGSSQLHEGPERNYDVAHFVGNPSRARELLGWQARVAVEDGVRRLVSDFSSVSAMAWCLPAGTSAARPQGKVAGLDSAAAI